jgi:hypothetical protein
VPPRRAASIAFVEDGQAVDPALLDQPRRELVGQVAGEGVRELAERRAVRLHPDGVDHRVGPATVGAVAQQVGDAVARGDVHRVDPMPLRHLQALRHEVDPDDLLRAANSHLIHHFLR